MSVFYWIGYVLGCLLFAGVPAALVALAAVRPLRRWWLRPLLRRVTGRTRFHRAFAEGLKAAPGRLNN